MTWLFPWIALGALLPLGLLVVEILRHTRADPLRFPKIARGWAGPRDVVPTPAPRSARPRRWRLWGGLALGLVALARPQGAGQEETARESAREVLVALDLSRSMLATDVRPSRLDRAKLHLRTLLDGMPGERVGLVVFAGTAFLQCPLSADHEVLREFLPELTPAFLPEGGSDYAAMLRVALESFSREAETERLLVVLSDGESTEETWREAAETLKARGVRVIALGLGTAEGSVVPDGKGGLVKDERGAAVFSRLGSRTLEELAALTGGTYADGSGWIEVAELLRRTLAAAPAGLRETTARTLRRDELFAWFLGPALALLLGSYLTEFPVIPKGRSLPLRPRRAASTRPPAASAAAVTLAAIAAITGFPTPAGASPPAERPAPLREIVGRLSGQDRLSAGDLRALAESTLAFADAQRGLGQRPPESVIRDALEAVDVGQSLDARAAPWEELRGKLRKHLEKPPEPPPSQPPPQPPEQNPESSKEDSSPSPQNSPADPSSSDKPRDPKQPSHKPPEQPPDGDSSPEKESPRPPPEQAPKAFDRPAAPSSSSTPERASPPAEEPPQPLQKAGGAPRHDGEQARKNPQLLVPLQKLEEVRNQDTPARLHQLLETSEGKKPVKKGKDW